jgi:phage portal protein BeeE
MGGTVSKKYKKQGKLVAPSDQEWQNLSQNEVLAKEYSNLALALQQSQSVAVQKATRLGGSPDEYLDLSKAFSIIDRNPQLLPYLSSVAKQSSGIPTGFTDHKGLLQKESPTGSVHTQNSGHVPGGWSGSGKRLPDAVPNARLLRDWADGNEWVRAAINIRRQQIGRANVAVMPYSEKRGYNKTLSKRIQLLLDQPNEFRQNYYELMAGCIDDILVLDRGVILKDMNAQRQPVHIYNEDGACIKIYPEWSGKKAEPRYLYENASGSRKVPLRNDECIVMIANPATYRFGLSPVQVLRNTIQADLIATKSATNMVDMKPPPHMIQLPGATQSQIEAIRMRYETEIAGQKEMFWIGGQLPATVTPLIFSAKDNQWLEWQVYLARKIAVLFQISPQQLGITYDVNKSTASSQQEIFEDTGLIPLLLLIEEYMNREILGDFAPQFPDGRANFDALNLRIIFPEVTESDRQMHAERAIKIATTGLAGLPSMTLNQVLSLFGEEPVDGGNTFYAPTREGPLAWLSYDGEVGDFTDPITGGSLGSQDNAGGPTDNLDPQSGNGPASYAGPIQSQGADSPEDQGVAAGKANADAKTPPAAPAKTPPAKTPAKTPAKDDKKDPKDKKDDKKSIGSREFGKRWIPQR